MRTGPGMKPAAAHPAEAAAFDSYPASHCGTYRTARYRHAYRP